MNGGAKATAIRLNALLAQAGLEPLEDATADQFENYLSLIIRWNNRTNLTALRDREEILSRHFVESIACARALSAEIRTLLDFGSGAGLPGIPIALCRPEIAVTLAESQGKKAAFLQEAVRALELTAQVYPERAENLLTKFDCVTLRAVDRMAAATKQAERLVSPRGWLALMTTVSEMAKRGDLAKNEFRSFELIRLPGSMDRVLALARRSELVGAGE